MLEARNLTVKFNRFCAIDRLNLQLPAGGLTALIGPNGAGKTTFFNVVSGLQPLAEGEILFEGKDIAGQRPEEITARGLVRTFQIARGFPRMTVFEHLMLYDQHHPGERFLPAFLGSAAARRHEAEVAERALAVARRLRLSGLIDNRITELSGGQKKLLEIGRALMASARLLLLDEPVAGVNPALSEEISDQLRRLVTEGLTILLVEHDMSMVARIADHVIVMAQGRHLASGSFDVIRDNPEVQEAYLGSGAIADAVG